MLKLVISGLSTGLMKNGKYKKALKTFKTIIIREKPVNKILRSFDTIQCLIKVNEIHEAFATVFRVLSLIDDHCSTNEFKDSFDKIYTNLDKLIETLIEIKKTDSIHHLIECQYNLSRKLCERKNLLIKLRDIGTQCLNVSEKRRSQNKTKKFKEYFPLMDKILETILMTTDVGLKEKSKLCASFLYFYGSCLNDTKDWINAIAVDNQAIGILKTGFDAEAYKIEELGHLYYNVGIAYRKKRMFEKARICFEKALLVFQKAYFTDVSRREKCLQNTKTMLRRC